VSDKTGSGRPALTLRPAPARLEVRRGGGREGPGVLRGRGGCPGQHRSKSYRKGRSPLGEGRIWGTDGERPGTPVPPQRHRLRDRSRQPLAQPVGLGGAGGVPRPRSGCWTQAPSERRGRARPLPGSEPPGAPRPQAAGVCHSPQAENQTVPFGWHELHSGSLPLAERRRRRRPSSPPPTPVSPGQPPQRCRPAPAPCPPRLPGAPALIYSTPLEHALPSNGARAPRAAPTAAGSPSDGVPLPENPRARGCPAGGHGRSPSTWRAETRS